MDNNNNGFMVYPQTSVPVPQNQPQTPPQAAPQSSELQNIEQQRQQLLREVETVMAQENALQGQLDQLGGQAKTIEDRKAELTKQLEQLNQQESSWYSKNNARMQALFGQNANQPNTTPVMPPTQQPIPPVQPTTVDTGKLELIRQTILAKLQQVPPRGTSSEQMTQLLSSGAQLYLAADLNGIVVVNGQQVIQIPSADLVAAGALVDLTALPKYPVT